MTTPRGERATPFMFYTAAFNALLARYSGQTDIVLGTPIAFSVAQQLGAPAEPFVLAVLFGANMSYMVPVSYQTNLLVMTAGGYRFSDFVRVGLPLQFIMWIGFSLILPVLYDL